MRAYHGCQVTGEAVPLLLRPVEDHEPDQKREVRVGVRVGGAKLVPCHGSGVWPVRLHLHPARGC